jgi:photosystem II stability/assembly factor-like uncharacterized protein
VVLLGVARAGRRLVAVGERGLVLLSNDDGASWRQARVPVAVSLTSVCFPDERNGWAAGHAGVVLHTADGGDTWTRQLDGRTAARLRLDQARTAAAAGGRSAQAQVVEAERLLAEGPDKPFLDVYFSDNQRGFVVGAYGLVFATTDGGARWLPAQDRIDNAELRHLYAVRAAAGVLYVVGERGALYRSNDRGETFTTLSSPYAGSYFGVLPQTRDRVLVYGLRGHAFSSTDAGGHWQADVTGSPAAVTAALPLPDGALMLVTGAGTVLISREGNGGGGFTRLALPPLPPVSGAVLASDGGLILTGPRGVVRLPPGAIDGGKRR